MRAILFSIIFVLLAGIALADVPQFCLNQIGSVDKCQKDLAISRDDPGYCKAIDDVGVRNDCYSYFAAARNDKSFCDLLRQKGGSFEDAFNCQKPFIKNMSHINICESFERDEKTQDDCFEYIYDKIEDVAICPKFNHPRDKINCFEEAASDNRDASYCDSIKQVKASDCEERGISMCDTSTKINDLVTECKEDLRLRERRDRCNSFPNEIKDKFDIKDSTEYLFKRDDPEKETFNIEIVNVELDIGLASVKIKALGNTKIYKVKIGNIITHQFVNMFVVNMWENDDTNESRVELCFFREPKEEVEEEPEEEVEEEPEIEEETEEPEESNESELDFEIEVESKEVHKEGVLRRAIRWFFGLFGVGK